MWGQRREKGHAILPRAPVTPSTRAPSWATPPAPAFAPPICLLSEKDTHIEHTSREKIHWRFTWSSPKSYGRCSEFTRPRWDTDSPGSGSLPLYPGGPGCPALCASPWYTLHGKKEWSRLANVYCLWQRKVGERITGSRLTLPRSQSPGSTWSAQLQDATVTRNEDNDWGRRPF